MDVRIGITTSFQENEQRLHHAYVRAVERAGGLPLIVPMLETDEAVHAFAGLLDGLVITGGPAVTDGLVPLEGTQELPEDIAETHPVRVASDRRILDAFLQVRKPILGICYGMQLLNAAAGGTIYADVQRQLEGAGCHSQKRADGGEPEHALVVTPGTHLARLLGPAYETGQGRVNTRHIQAVASVGAAYRVAATGPDGVIEAIESADGHVLGVQFHPERMGEAMLPLFRHLVAQARRHKKAPAGDEMPAR